MRHGKSLSFVSSSVKYYEDQMNWCYEILCKLYHMNVKDYYLLSAFSSITCPVKAETLSLLLVCYCVQNEGWYRTGIALLLIRKVNCYNNPKTQRLKEKVCISFMSESAIDHLGKKGSPALLVITYSRPVFYLHPPHRFLESSLEDRLTHEHSCA